MSQSRMINALHKISREEAESLKRVNQCEQVILPSPLWEIYWGTKEQLLLPDSLEDLRRDMLLNRIINQSILIFESAEEVYLVVCLIQFAIEVIKTAQLDGSEAAFSLVIKLWSPN